MLQVLDTLIVVAWYAFVVLGSLAILVRTSRGKRIYPGQAGALPEKWVRWMLGEQPKQRR
jgi:hypothetical protein